MNDEELIAEARRVARMLSGSRSDLGRLAAELMRQVADLAEARAAAPDAIVLAWCKRCEQGTASISCPKCDGPACAGCGRCPPCDGDLPAEEE